jgi:hypothetical protein
MDRIVPSKNQHKVKNFVFVRNTRWPSSTKNSSLNQRDNSKTSKKVLTDLEDDECK